jgi:hypothetical protein
MILLWFAWHVVAPALFLIIIIWFFVVIWGVLRLLRWVTARRSRK